jgi:hypothetical protein
VLARDAKNIWASGTARNRKTKKKILQNEELYNLQVEDVGLRAGCRKRQNKTLRHLYSAPNIIKMTNSRRIRWARNVT